MVGDGRRFAGGGSAGVIAAAVAPGCGATVAGSCGGTCVGSGTKLRSSAGAVAVAQLRHEAQVFLVQRGLVPRLPRLLLGLVQKAVSRRVRSVSAQSAADFHRRGACLRALGALELSVALLPAYITVIFFPAGRTGVNAINTTTWRAERVGRDICMVGFGGQRGWGWGRYTYHAKGGPRSSSLESPPTTLCSPSCRDARPMVL